MAQATFSFDTPLERMGVLEITGAESTLVAPDPNTFGGEIRINRGSEAWESVVATGAEHGRCIGAVDMARAIRSGGAHSTDATLGLHILDAMVATETSIETATFVEVESRFDPVAAPIGLGPDEAHARAMTHVRLGGSVRTCTSPITSGSRGTPTGGTCSSTVTTSRSTSSSRRSNAATST